MPNEFRDARRDFLARFPSYARTSSLDALRHREYSRLDRTGHAYLDYTGGSLYADCQLDEHRRLLERTVLGNPHSMNPSSLRATGLADEAREEVLSFFGASPAEYDVVFTSNATGAIKLVAEAYPFSDESVYLLTYDNHNSVNGVREYAARAGARVVYLPVRSPDLRLDTEPLASALGRYGTARPKLFAYPAQSNFSGVQHPAEWVDLAHGHGWDVLFDCAAFAPTNRLDLSAVGADLVPISFYKLFGYPTGVGALIARRSVLARLRRPWFSGGTILVVSVQDDAWVHRAPGHMAFEDGTIDYANLPAVTLGLRYLRRVGLDLVHERVTALTGWLLESLAGLRHPNGRPMVRILGPEENERRGATIAFAMEDAEGVPYDVGRVETLAGERGISLRTGCFCNPGAREVAHGLTSAELAGCFADLATPVPPDECNRRILDATGRLPSGYRASLGIASDFADCWRLIGFLASLSGTRAEDVGTPSDLSPTMDVSWRQRSRSGRTGVAAAIASR